MPTKDVWYLKEKYLADALGATKNLRLIEARTQKFKSMRKASEMVGVSYNTYRKWEHGQSVPGRAMLDRLCEVFEASPAQLGFVRPMTPVEELALLKEQGVNFLANLFPGMEWVFEEAVLTHELLKIRLFERVTIWGSREWKLEDLQRDIDYELRKLEVIRRHYHNEEERQARCLTLRTLGMLPVSLLDNRARPGRITIKHDEWLAYSAASITACWHQSNYGNHVLIDDVISPYLLLLTKALEKKGKHQREVAHLAAQGHLLLALLLGSQMHFEEAHTCFNMAYSLASLTEDRNLLMAIANAFTRYCCICGKYEQALGVSEHCLPFVDEISPLMRTRVYLGLALAYACNQRQEEALQFLKHARETMPAEPEADISFLIADCTLASLPFYEGLVYDALEKSEQAVEAFTLVHEMQQKIDISEPIYIESLLYRARHALLLADVGQACDCLEAAAVRAMALKHLLYYSKARIIYQLMRKEWPAELRVRGLGEFFL